VGGVSSRTTWAEKKGKAANASLWGGRKETIMFSDEKRNTKNRLQKQEKGNDLYNIGEGGKKKKKAESNKAKKSITGPGDLQAKGVGGPHKYGRTPRGHANFLMGSKNVRFTGGGGKRRGDPARTENKGGKEKRNSSPSSPMGGGGGKKTGFPLSREKTSPPPPPPTWGRKPVRKYQEPPDYTGGNQRTHRAFLWGRKKKKRGGGTAIRIRNRDTSLRNRERKIKEKNKSSIKKVNKGNFRPHNGGSASIEGGKGGGPQSSTIIPKGCLKKGTNFQPLKKSSSLPRKREGARQNAQTWGKRDSLSFIKKLKSTTPLDFYRPEVRP